MVDDFQAISIKKGSRRFKVIQKYTKKVSTAIRAKLIYF